MPSPYSMSSISVGWCLAALLISTPVFGDTWMADQSPSLLAYDELAALSTEQVPQDLDAKLQTLLNVPIVSNGAARSGASPAGTLLRVVFWNLERGYRYDELLRALTSIELPSGSGTDRTAPGEAGAQASMLREADVLVLNEVDLGVSRSGYRDIAAGLASTLGMNYAYGVEFVEVDPLLLGLEALKGDADSVREWERDRPVRRDLFRGLHGNAILSRYPILQARNVRLPECYDWYGEEKRAVAKLEQGKRWTVRRFFQERVSREIRRGGRMALLVTLEVPSAPGGQVTVVSTHLENRCRPACRQEQMAVVTEAVEEVDHAVVIAGDLNTTGTNSAPTSIIREVSRRATSLKFWLEMAVRQISPVALPQLGFVPANHFKNLRDPTVFHMPLFLPNRERGLFTNLRKFRFKDGGAFDFRGDSEHTRDGRKGTLANSNERGLKGFAPTFSFERTFTGVVGKYKLDWIFVKPAADGSLAPRFPATMNALNEVSGTRISDHPPISVDLRLPSPVTASR